MSYAVLTVFTFVASAYYFNLVLTLRASFDIDRTGSCAA